MELDVGDDKEAQEGGSGINSDFQSERRVGKCLFGIEMVLLKSGFCRFKSFIITRTRICSNHTNDVSM